MLLVNGEKMSKSLGNFTTLRDALARAPGEAIRLLLLRTHYRSTPDFSDAALAEARRELDRFYRALERYPALDGAEVPAAVTEALCDDLNTPLALSAMHALADRALAGDFDAARGLRAAGEALGLLAADPAAWFRGGDRRRGGDRGGDRRARGRAQGARLRPRRCDPGGAGGEGHRAGGRPARHDVAARVMNGACHHASCHRERRRAEQAKRIPPDAATAVAEMRFAFPPYVSRDDRLCGCSVHQGLP